MGCEAQRRPGVMLGLWERGREASLVEPRRCASPFPLARSRGQAGFTLVELLTVITIIAILATLLMTTLSSVKRKAREAVCTSNLHQIGIALNLYIEEHGKRPPDLQTLALTKFLGDARVLICPADKAGGKLNSPVTAQESVVARSPTASNAAELRTSYQHPLGWPDEQWTRLLQTPSGAGVAVCFYHDIRSANASANASAIDNQLNGQTEAMILRGNLDGTVVRRQVFGTELASNTMNSSTPPSANDLKFGGSSAPAEANSPGTGSSFAASGNTPPVASPEPSWSLFSDDASP